MAICHRTYLEFICLHSNPENILCLFRVDGSAFCRFVSRNDGLVLMSSRTVMRALMSGFGNTICWRTAKVLKLAVESDRASWEIFVKRKTYISEIFFFISQEDFVWYLKFLKNVFSYKFIILLFFSTQFSRSGSGFARSSIIFCLKIADLIAKSESRKKNQSTSKGRIKRRFFDPKFETKKTEKKKPGVLFYLILVKFN